MRRFLRWLAAPRRTPLEVGGAFILGNAIGVEAWLRSPFWVSVVVVFVVMGGVALLADVIRHVTGPKHPAKEG